MSFRNNALASAAALASFGAAQAVDASEPQPQIPAPPSDGGPGVPANPVQPGSGIPTNDPATNPSSPVNHPAPEEGGSEDPFAQVRAEMGNSDPGAFLEGFLNGEGLLPPEDAQPPVGVPPVQPPANGQVPVQGSPQATPPLAPPANGQAAPVDPNQLALMLGQAPAGQVPGYVPQPPVPPQPAPVPPQAAPQPSPQAPASAPPAWQPFDRGFEIPASIATAMEHDDPKVRMEAIGATMAATGNATAQRVIDYVRSTIIPEVMASTVSHVNETTFQERLMGDIFEGRPQLRYVAPHLITQAINIVSQAERARGVQGYSKEIGHKIGILAATAAQQLAAGQVPQFPPQGAPPQQFQPQPTGFAPPLQQQQQYGQPAPQPQPYLVEQPQQGQDGRWYGKLNTGQWVETAPPQQQQQQAAPPQPWMSGQAAGGFGMPQAPAITPDSEFQSFMSGGGW